MDDSDELATAKPLECAALREAFEKTERQTEKLSARLGKKKALKKLSKKKIKNLRRDLVQKEKNYRTDRRAMMDCEAEEVEMAEAHVRVAAKARRRVRQLDTAKARLDGTADALDAASKAFLLKAAEAVERKAAVKVVKKYAKKTTAFRKAAEREVDSLVE